MLDFNLEYYRTFYFVGKLRSFTKAAQALFISQPAVSQAIHKLEEYYHCSLFVRRQREMQLTEEGMVLYQYVTAAFDQFIMGEQRLSRTLYSGRTAFKISATETPLHVLALPAIDLFRERNPDCAIYFSSGGSTQACLDDLKNGVADIAMGVSPIAIAEGLSVYDGPNIESVAVANPNYFRFNAPLSAQQLSEYPMICTSRGSSARTQLDLWFLEQGLLAEPAYAVQTTSTILSLTAKGLGIGILPAFFAQENIAQGTLVEVPLCQPLPCRKIVVAHRADLVNRPIAIRFIDMLTELGLIERNESKQ